MNQLYFGDNLGVLRENITFKKAKREKTKVGEETPLFED